MEMKMEETKAGEEVEMEGDMAIGQPSRIVTMAPTNIRMAAMDSPVFDYVVFNRPGVAGAVL